MRLYITEKKRTGKPIGDLLGLIKDHGNYLETKDGLVTWCRGHIVSSASPAAYGVKSFPGRPSDLPIIPQKWEHVIAEDTKALFDNIKALVARPDVTEIINASDADREGQLIVDEVLLLIGNKKPVKRLWLNAINPTDFKKAMDTMKDNSTYQNLYQAALAREQADWIVGMNMSRLACMISEKGVYSVGRVQTPVLALLAKRQKEIEEFVPVKYFVPSITVKVPAGTFQMEWAGEERFYKREDAQKVLDLCHGEVVLKVDSKNEAVPPPLPYCLSTIQAWAGKNIGISPKETLERVQSLYEDGYVTYPRVDCEYYPEEEWSNGRSILPKLSKLLPVASGATPGLKSRAWNDAKVTAHFALMPTESVPGGSLAPGLKPIYEAIARQYVAQFYPNLLQTRTSVSTKCGEEPFKATGRIIVDPGWSIVFDKKVDKESSLPKMNSGDIGEIVHATLLAKETSPPAPITQGGIILVMKNIVRYIDDPLAKKYLQEADGLGRESSRATVVQTLLDRGYVELTGKGVDKTLSVTKKGLDLLNIVPEEVKDPILTALWERDLDKISKGTLKHEDFSKSIAEDIAKWCEEGKKKIRVGAVWVSDKPDTGKTTSVKQKGSKVAGRKTTTKSPAKKSAQLK